MMMVGGCIPNFQDFPEFRRQEVRERIISSNDQKNWLKVPDEVACLHLQQVEWMWEGLNPFSKLNKDSRRRELGKGGLLYWSLILAFKLLNEGRHLPLLLQSCSICNGKDGWAVSNLNG